MEAPKKIIADRSFYRPVLIAIIIVAVTITGVIFIPKLFAMPIEEPKAANKDYSEYHAFYLEAKQYNYAYGRDYDFEEKLKKQLDKGGNGYYYALMASAEYYYGIRDFDTALEFIDSAELYVPEGADTEELTDELIDLNIRIYTKNGDSEQLDYWQRKYDEQHSEPSCDEAAEAEP